MPPEMTINACAAAAKASGNAAIATDWASKESKLGWIATVAARNTISSAGMPNSVGWRARRRPGLAPPSPARRHRCSGFGNRLVSRRQRHALSSTGDPSPCAARSNVPSSAAPAGISSTILPPNKTIARSQAKGYFGQLGGEQQDRRSARGQFAHERVDLMLRADVDATRGVEAEQCLEAVREPSRDHHLLLIAAAEPPQFRFRARVDPELAHRRRHAFALAAQGIGPHLEISRNAGRATFSRIERCCISACNRFAGTSTSPAAMASAGWRNVNALAAGENLAAVKTADARDAVEQFLLTLALQGGDAQNFARPQTERDIVEQRAAAQAAHLERRVSRVDTRAAPASAAPLAAASPLDSPSINETIRSLASRRDIDHADDDPVAKHRRPVAERRDLGHSMRNEDYRMPALAPVADDLEYALGQIRGQRGGNFVEQEYEADRKRARAPSRSGAESDTEGHERRRRSEGSRPRAPRATAAPRSQPRRPAACCRRRSNREPGPGPDRPKRCPRLAPRRESETIARRRLSRSFPGPGERRR